MITENIIPELWAKEFERQAKACDWFFDTFYTTVDRTWKERLFSLPWKPFRTKKLIEKKTDGIRSDTVKINKNYH